MDNHELLEEKIASLSPDECFDTLIGMIREMSREELIAFAGVTKTYKTLHINKDIE